VTASISTGGSGAAGSIDEKLAVASSSRQRRSPWRVVLRQPLAAISLCYLTVLAAAAAAASTVAPYGPNQIDLDSVLSGPSRTHLLGTDALGRDVLSRLVFGGRLSLVHAAVAVVTFVLVAVSSGIVAGYFGGWADRIFTSVVDVVIALPALVVLLVVLTIFGSNMVIAMTTIGVFSAPGFARVVRGSTLAVRHELYISAARVFGIPSRYILLRHVLPRITGPIIVFGSLFAGGALLIDAGLSYLGFGPEPPAPSWGGMIIEAASVVDLQPWLLVPPGVTLALAILAFGLLGDAVRDATVGRMVPLTVAPGRGGSPRRRQPPMPREAADLPTHALLSVQGVSISLPSASGLTNVVEDLSLDIHAGETVGLVGESGCGKTITGRAILGLLPAGSRVTAGSIYFEGVDLTTAGPQALRRLRGASVAMISQEPIASLDPMFTAGQQIAELVRRHRGSGSRKEIRTRTLDLLATVSLPEPDRVARRYPHELSGGMAQRVAIAMALAGEPRLLIADEPTTALDVTVQAEILALLGNLQADRGMAILLISHDWGVVAAACHRAYVMYAGHVMESCAVEEMFDQPRHPYTLGLLNSAPGRARPRTRLAAIGGAVPDPGSWPPGCHFAPRCPFATPECSSAPVPLLLPTPGHGTRCIHHERVSGVGGHD
jgi:peptide/nickel transport system permease protein